MHANLLDASRGYSWLAFWQPFNLTTAWARYTATAELPRAVDAHLLQASLVLGVPEVVSSKAAAIMGEKAHG